ncbi:hypothetical protein L7F22_010233 [Adiantum nelumboides]|nr:hypothetical protein [Adiantum nelumboides]
MALHEALVNGMVHPPLQNAVSPSMQAGSSKAPAPPLPLNLSGPNLGMSSKFLFNANLGGQGLGGYPTYASSVRRGLDPLFIPTSALNTGPQCFPFPMVNPLWNMEMERCHFFDQHKGNKDKAGHARSRDKIPADEGNFGEDKAITDQETLQVETEDPCLCRKSKAKNSCEESDDGKLEESAILPFLLEEAQSSSISVCT